MDIKVNVELGWKVKDVISDFEGIVSGIVFYSTGCHQALVSPKVDKEGKKVEGLWFDVQRLERVGSSHIILDNSQYNGPDIAPCADSSNVSPSVM